ncbi:phosphodiester glycosidase family protein [Streptomyces showdoensis]|uniref:phosphodiester glycosidase family protein n=1 Tax=Streptomyces showdoensis TaxID=68268 RepID=UPI0013F4EF84|nr:phosphodiester glycosidase family protein [Streptomyces showdoensis]
MRRIRRITALTVALGALVTVAPATATDAASTDAAATAPVGRMPLGPDDLVTVAKPAQTPAEGITYEKYTQGRATDVWSVEVLIKQPSTWSAGRKENADAVVAALQAKQFAARVDTWELPAGPGVGAGLPRQYTVRVGAFAPDRSADAAALLKSLQAAGFTGRTVYTAQDGNPSTGPWEVRVVRVDPSAALTFKAVHGSDVARAETVRDMGAAAGALVAVNGSDFDIDSPNNPAFSDYDGDPQGLYVRSKDLLSEANNGRTALLLEGTGARVRVDEVSTRTQVTAHDGAVKVIDGINRATGRNVGCGGVGDDRRRNAKDELVLELRPVRNTLCVDPDEIVVFRPEWGTDTPSPAAGDSVDVVMDGNWVVTGLRQPAGGPVPAGGRVMQGIGAGADWLRAHSTVGKAFKPGTSITDSQGASVSGSALSAVAGGGPALVRDGEILVNADANGMLNPDTNVVTSGVVQRHPRTLAGVTASGELLLVNVDGRLPQTSVGVTVHEAAAVMKWLGAKDALSLGSGGDTTLLINGTLYNRPMDSWQAAASVERKVGNAVVVVPR